MSGQPVRRVASLFFIAGWFAMAGGLLEGCSYWLLQEAGLLTRDTELRSVDLNILWASLLVYGGFSLLVLLVVWPILSILARKYHKPWEGAAFIIFGWLLFYDLLSVPARLHERGAIILALGLATAVCRRMSRDTDRSLAWMRHTLKPLTALAALACVIGVAAQPILEKVRGARLPAPPGNVPNVLFIVLDTLRADRLNAYGYARPTSPFLERYAQQAVLFEKAFSNSSWTLPSHASFFTGWMPSVHGGTRQKINRDLPTLAQELDKRGYYTAGFAANTYWTTRFSGVASGFLHWENIFAGPMDSFMNTLWGRKIIKYAARVVDWNGEPGRMMASDINARFLRWLDARPERPFFVYLNYMDVHDPYNPLLEYSRKISAHPEELTPQPPVRLHGSAKIAGPDNPERFGESYDACIAGLDAQLEKLFNELHRRDLDKNLLVIMVGDHGESLGERGHFNHGTSLHVEEIHVPLLIRFPGRTPPGTRVTETAGLENLPATIAAFTGIAPGTFPGRSLEWWWQGRATENIAVLQELEGEPIKRQNPPARPAMKSVITDRWHLIVDENNKVELFDWLQDPIEEHDLSAMQENLTLVADLRARMKGILALRPGFSASLPAATGSGMNQETSAGLANPR